MILFINTASQTEIEVKILDGKKIIVSKKIEAARAQAEKLLVLIEKLLKQAKLKLKDLEKIVVINQGGSFTSLRIGVVTANALGFALGIPVEGTVGQAKKVKGQKEISIVAPIYDREPDII